jgi:hypothetical protein
VAWISSEAPGFKLRIFTELVSLSFDGPRTGNDLDG